MSFKIVRFSMAFNIDNNAYEVVITPSKKRKRCFEKPYINGLSNKAFSSTPKKEAKILIDNYHRFPNGNNHRSDINGFPRESFLEVKSISDIADHLKENVYEIVRKPPKKKKKQEREDACFENSALNLNCPEKTFNPFEVKRDKVLDNDKNCFTNPGLNIRIPENAAVNPYEIARYTEIKDQANGIENPALEMPTCLSIALPFKPTLGCRIDFQNMELNNLTPSKLLAEKLIFSPVNVTKPIPAPRLNFRRSFSAISEEAVDIGKELDCYQLELENSINEAKIRKDQENGRHSISKPKKSFESRLDDVREDNTEEFNISITEVHVEIKQSLEEGGCEKEVIPINLQTLKYEQKKGDVLKEENIDHKLSDSEKNDNSELSLVDEDDDDFPPPKPFVRAYRKPVAAPRKILTSQASDDHIQLSSSDQKENKNKVTEAIRKSFRKFIHPSNKPAAKAKTSEQGLNLMETIRHSIRRKTKTEKPIIADKAERDISICENYDRQVFRSLSMNNKNDQPATLSNDIKISLRSSFRKSARGVRNHVLKSVFHKNVEEYDLKD